MKNFYFVLFTVMLTSAASHACTQSTIDNIVAPVDPYYTNAVGSQLRTALDTLGLCDENLQYAGGKLGTKFDPYYTVSVQSMASVVAAQSTQLPRDMINGLGMGIISKIDLYYPNSTYSMLRSIERLAAAAPEYAKQFALTLLQKQDTYYTQANSSLLQTVQNLKNMVPKPPPEPVPGPFVPPPVASPIWAFRSNNEPCNGLTGPWGYYELCPRYYASVSDQFGNRIVLACKAENFGIEFRVTMAPSYWVRIANTNIQTVAFGTNNMSQSLGAPYVISQANTLMPQEPLAPEILAELRKASRLTVGVRSNAGELNTNLNFNLKGSNAAIGQLLQYCH